MPSLHRTRGSARRQEPLAILKSTPLEYGKNDAKLISVLHFIRCFTLRSDSVFGNQPAIPGT